SQADFMRYLFAWQHVDPASRLAGLDGLRAVVEALDGFELAADAWERAVLPARVDGYQPSLLDTLSLTGEVGWARLSPAAEGTQPIGASPIALFLREHAEAWTRLRSDAESRSAADTANDAYGSPATARVLATLTTRGASFVHELMSACAATE